MSGTDAVCVCVRCYQVLQRLTEVRGVATLVPGQSGMSLGGGCDRCTAQMWRRLCADACGDAKRLYDGYVSDAGESWHDLYATPLRPEHARWD
eukprot:3938833-Rhodomonas_salina.2